MHELTSNDYQRYNEQIKLPDIGMNGQLKLKSARVLCVGAGGLGSPLLLYLAAAGIGTLGIMDDDQVEWGNLHRQILYQSQHIHQKKASVAAMQLQLLNPNINTDVIIERLSPQNAKDMINRYDIIADCSDNFATRYLINDTCFQLNIPFVSASISQFQGQCVTFAGKKGPCYRCLFPEIPPAILNCAEGGVLGVLPGILGTLQATEIIKYILSLGSLLIGRLLTINSLNMAFREYQFTPNPDCPLCGKHKKNTPHLDIPAQCTTSSVSFHELKTLLENKSNILLDVRTTEEHAAHHLEGDIWIPLAELSERLHELKKETPIIAYCHTGPRSIQAVTLLQKAGFKSAHYLKGGITSAF